MIQESCSHWVTSVLGSWPLVVWQERKSIVDKGKGGAKANAADTPLRALLFVTDLKIVIARNGISGLLKIHL